MTRPPDTKTVPIGLRKMKDLGIKNAIIEVDLVWSGIDYSKFKVKDINKLLSERMEWCGENLSEDSKIFINLRNVPDDMIKKPKRIFKVIRYLSSLLACCSKSPASIFLRGLVYGLKPFADRWIPVDLMMAICLFTYTSSGDWQTVPS